MPVQSGNTAEMVSTLVLGGSLTEAAIAGAVSVSTVQRRLRDPEIAQMIAEARSEMAREAIGRIRSLRHKALQKLDALIEDDELSPTLLLRVLDLVLRYAVAADRDAHERAHAELVSKIEALRTQVGASQPAHTPESDGSDR
jgi:hypothetical protein